jgi:hypothetical protein
LQKEGFQKLIRTAIGRVIKERWKKAGVKIKFKMVNRKMVSKGDTVQRSLREKEFEYLISRETVRDSVFSLRRKLDFITL